MKEFWYRLKMIVTGKIVWVDQDENETWEHNRRLAWRLAKPNLYNFWWVKKWGKLSCGCTINPITRRRLLTLGSCREHMPWPMFEEES